MKKNRLMALLFTGAMLLSMTACGKDPSELVYLRILSRTSMSRLEIIPDYRQRLQHRRLPMMISTRRL